MARKRASDFKHWKAKNEVSNLASLQRGARNFLGYCSGCHSLKYMRYSRMAEDLEIPEEQLERDLLLPGDKPADYILTQHAGRPMRPPGSASRRRICR